MNGGMGFGQDLRNMRGIVSLLNDPSGVADLLTESHPETDDSPAEILADIVNTTRADNRRIGQTIGVEIEAELMTPEKAADLLAGTVGGDGIDLVVMFNELADQRERILRELLDADEYEEFRQQKLAIMHTHPGPDEAADPED